MCHNFLFTEKLIVDANPVNGNLETCVFNQIINQYDNKREEMDNSRI